METIVDTSESEEPFPILGYLALTLCFPFIGFHD